MYVGLEGVRMKIVRMNGIIVIKKSLFIIET